MARLQLSKSSLAQQKARLETYQRYLPVLDLKRQQLLVERSQARAALQTTEDAVAQVRASAAHDIPMLSNLDVDLTDLVTLGEVRLGQENKVGTLLPYLIDADIRIKPYSLLTNPHWVDAVAERLERITRLEVRRRIEVRRLELLEQAVDTITQRVNLFEKVLIPKTRDNIKRIRVALSDAEMAAVVRSKIAKRKRAREAAS